MENWFVIFAIENYFIKENMAKKLSEEIEERIINGFLEQISYILIGIFIIILIVVVVGSFNSPRQEAVENNCDRPYIQCEVVDTSKLLRGVDCPENTTDVLGNIVCSVGVSYHPVIYRETICGYEEAFFFFENIKNNFDGDKSKLVMECE